MMKFIVEHFCNYKESTEKSCYARDVIPELF